jgi:hypothetical protein
MFVCCECCVLSVRGLCDKLITRPEESYRLQYVVVCDLETSRMRRPWHALGRSATAQKSPYFYSISCEWKNSPVSFAVHNFVCFWVFSSEVKRAWMVKGSPAYYGTSRIH